MLFQLIQFHQSPEQRQQRDWMPNCQSFCLFVDDPASRQFNGTFPDRFGLEKLFIHQIKRRMMILLLANAMT
jgi:hypothetical protein